MPAAKPGVRDFRRACFAMQLLDLKAHSVDPNAPHFRMQVAKNHNR